MPLIRCACLTTASKWMQPEPEEILSVLVAVRYRTGAEVGARNIAQLLGLGDRGEDTVTSWMRGGSPIPYSNWALLCEMAGLGLIWRTGERTKLLG